MKKYLPGIIAFSMAIGMFAFTEAPFKKTKTTFADPCSEAGKKWFAINLSCSGQMAVTDVRNPLNYVPMSAANVAATCTGSECVCAIWACPSTGNQTLPIITSSTSIYTELYNFFEWGVTTANIANKDEFAARKRQ